MTPQERNEETVRRQNRAFTEKKLDELLACFADDAVQHEPFVDGPIAGKNMLRDYYVGSFDYFPDETVAIERLYSVGNNVIGQWVCRGTQTGEFMGLAPTGRRFDVPECGIYTFDEKGLIKELWVYVDSGTIAKQLGYRFERDESVPAAT
ncbi:MAG: ester cyclase [Gaiellaceae bacterium]